MTLKQQLNSENYEKCDEKLNHLHDLVQLCCFPVQFGPLPGLLFWSALIKYKKSLNFLSVLLSGNGFSWSICFVSFLTTLMFSHCEVL